MATQLSTTTLNGAVGSSDPIVRLVATTAITAIGQWLFTDSEAMRVTALPQSNGNVAVQRGVGGSRVLQHATGLTVYIGTAQQFYGQDPEGTPPTIPTVLPWINVTNGNIWTVTDGAWVLSGGVLPDGDVVGPASATDGNPAVFDGTTGKLLKDGPVGVTAGPFTTITSITVENGIVTDLQGS